MKRKIHKVMYCTNPSGYSARLCIPKEFLRDLFITPNEPKVEIIRVENGILIRKYEED